MEFWALLFWAAVLGLLPAFIARRKGRSFGAWWFYGAALFIVAIIHVLVISPNEDAIQATELAAGKKRCPYCAEFVQGAARVCKHCGRDIA